MQHNRENITQRVKKRVFFCYKTTDLGVAKLHSLSKYLYSYLNIKLSHSMNGSDIWGSSAPYGDVLPVFKWNIYKRMSTFPSKLL